MLIETPKKSRNILILSKNGIRLCELNKEEPKKINNDNLPSIIGMINRNKIYKTMDINKDSKIKEWKKKLFLNNILSTEKNYFLKDYIRKKETELIQDKNKDVNKLKKIFFNEEKIDESRTSYFNKDVYNYNNKKEKIPIMVKDIEANLLLYKKNKNKRFKHYLKKQLEFDLHEKKYYSDFNDKLGVKNVYIKTDIFSNQKKRFMIYKTNYFSPNDFKTFSSTYNNLRKKIVKGK